MKCASRICAPNKLSSEISTIKKFASWNDFPKSVVNSIKGVTTVLANCLLIKYQFICIRILLYFSLVKLIVNVVNITSFSP